MMIHISEDIFPNLKSKHFFLYGAGSTGKLLFAFFTQNGFNIAAFIDDDPLKCGKVLFGVPIFDLNRIVSLYNDQPIDIILTSIYAKQILKKLEQFNNITTYEMFDYYSSKYDASVNILKQCSELDLKIFKKRIDALYRYFEDSESIRVLEAHYDFLLHKDLSVFFHICSEFEQYFIPEVLNKICEPIGIVDAGAYEGELNRVLDKFNIPIRKWFCFEANPTNCINMSKDSKYGDRQICINKGLWNSNSVFFFDSDKSGTASKIVNYKTNQSINTVTIDSYFETENIDYIKMDIEGAELKALQGGINVIKRDRPILAISIYHTLEDFYLIPEYLIGQLHNYSWYIRHHSLIFSETVLYGIPNE